MSWRSAGQPHPESEKQRAALVARNHAQKGKHHHHPKKVAHSKRPHRLNKHATHRALVDRAIGG